MLARFKTKKIITNMTVGECLKKKRGELGMTIKEIGDKLKIRENYLENLENNNYDKLPPDVYVKGFIKGYCQVVGYNFEKMLNLYNKERGVGERIQKKKATKKAEKASLSTGYPIITPKIITLVFSIFVVSVIGYYLWYQINSFSSTPYLFVSNPLSDQIVNDTQLQVSGETEDDIIIKINGEDIYVNPTGFFSETIYLKPGNNTIEIEAVNKFNRTTSEIRNIIYQKELEPVPVSIKEEKISEDDKNLDVEIFDEDMEFIGS